MKKTTAQNFWIMNCLRIKLLVLIIWASDSDASYFENKLLKDLFGNYTKDVRPVLNDGDAVNVTFGLTLHQIMDVDEKNQIMTTSVWARQKWHNPYLKWDKSDYGNVTTINVQSRHVWLPDIVLYNNADESIDFRGYMDKLKTRIQIFHDGTNKWLAPVMLRSKCKIDVEYFPFDSQICKLKFGSWTYDGYRVNLVNESDHIDQGTYIESAEWNLASAPVKRNVQIYFCCPEPYPDVTFYLHIQRRSLFYLTNLILPLIVISALITFVFTLPPESGERISLSITILLAMTVFMLLVTETIPPTSEVIPLVGKFYMTAMFEMALALIVTCYILRCYHSKANEVPPWMKRYVVGKLARFFGVRKSKALLKEEKEEETMRRRKNKAMLLERMMDRIEKYEDDPEKIDLNNGNVATKEENKTLTDKLRIHYPRKSSKGFLMGYEFQNGVQVGNALLSKKTESCVSTKPEKMADDVGSKILEKLEVISGNVLAKERVDIVKEQWHIVATVVDRVAMWTFAVAIIATTSIIFYKSPGYVP